MVWFIDSLELLGSPTNIFTTVDIFTILILSTLLCFIVALTYKYTHEGISYSPSFVHTTIMFGRFAQIGYGGLLKSKNTRLDTRKNGARICQCGELCAKQAQNNAAHQGSIMEITMKNYYYFPALKNELGGDLINPGSWDVIRTVDWGGMQPFLVHDNRSLWEKACLVNENLHLRAKRIVEILNSKYRLIRSFGSVLLI